MMFSEWLIEKKRFPSAIIDILHQPPNNHQPISVSLTWVNGGLDTPINCLL